MSNREIVLSDYHCNDGDVEVRNNPRGAVGELAEELLLRPEDDAEEEARIQWLRQAAQEAIEQLDRGEGISFTSSEALGDWLHGLACEASERVAARRHAA